MRCDALRVSWLMLLLRPVCGSIGAQPFLQAMAACTFLVQCGWSGAEPTLMSWTVWLHSVFDWSCPEAPVYLAGGLLLILVVGCESCLDMVRLV